MYSRHVAGTRFHQQHDIPKPTKRKKVEGTVRVNMTKCIRRRMLEQYTRAATLSAHEIVEGRVLA